MCKHLRNSAFQPGSSMSNGRPLSTAQILGRDPTPLPPHEFKPKSTIVEDDMYYHIWRRNLLSRRNTGHRRGRVRSSLNG